MSNRSNETVINLDQSTDVLRELAEKQAQTLINTASEHGVAEIFGKLRGEAPNPARDW